jgi:hypothetical protein
MTERYQYGQGVKNWPAKLIKFDPEVLKTLEEHRGNKSWTKFMAEIAKILKTRHI